MKTTPSTRSTVRQLRDDVESICFPRGRVVGSPGHRKARKVLCTRLEEVGCVPFSGDSFELPYQRGGTSFCNLIGVIPGSNPRLAPLLVGAHYDSADRDIPLPVLAPLLFITGTESHPDLQDVLEDAGVADGLKLVPTLNSYVGDMSDHGVFREHGVPYFFLSCGHWAHYHQPTDTPDRLNYRKMERITQQVCGLFDFLSAFTPVHQVDPFEHLAQRKGGNGEFRIVVRQPLKHGSVWLWLG